MADKVFVSPGVYTSEKDLTFVTRQVGVTTLGLVGETTKGPAFQPIFISNYGEFQSFFGGLNNTLVNSPIDGNGAPLYELPYIAKSYLSQSNQLFVTRVLGFSGYDAGQAWGITLDAALDPSTTNDITASYNPYVDYSATTGGVIIGLNIYSQLLNDLYNLGQVDMSFLSSFFVGQTVQQSTGYEKTASGLFTGASFDFTSVGRGTAIATGNSVQTSGPTVVDPLFSYTGSQAGTLLSVSSSSNIFTALYNTSLIDLSSIVFSGIGATSSIPATYYSIIPSGLTGASFNYIITATGLTPSAINTITTGITNGPTTYPDAITPLINYSYNITGDTIDFTIYDSCLSDSLAQGNSVLSTQINTMLGMSNIGDTFIVPDFYWFNGIDYSGVSSTYETIATGTTIDGAGIEFITGVTSGITTCYSGAPVTQYITGTTSGDSITYSASGYSYITGTTSGMDTYSTGYGYSDIEDKVVALLRSRGKVNASTQNFDFQVGSASALVFDTSVTGAETNPLGTFMLSGFSDTQGAFDYSCSFDKTQRNYLTKVLGRGAQDGRSAIFVEELFDNMFKNDLALGKVRGINLSLVQYNGQMHDYLQEYQPAVTPYVVSELRGTDVLKLFRFFTISDGNAANEQFKISILNIRPDNKEFDIHIRAFYDTDAQPSVLESFSRCVMDPTSNNYVARRIGTLDGTYASKSSYVLIELDDTSDTSEAFPAGFIGYPLRDYTMGSISAQTPNIVYKTAYGTFENKRKFYLGLTDSLNVTNISDGTSKIGIDADMFDYKGAATTGAILTHGFHMDIDASTAMINNIPYTFDAGDWTFRTDADVTASGSPYTKVYSRKFTFAPFGGFDGWDIYRTRRTNLDSFIINGTKGNAGLQAGTFSNKTLSNGDLGINSDYYAYLEAIWTFKNPEAVNVNVFATPGIDTTENSNLVEASIEMIEQDRADSLYIVTTPDTDPAGQVLTVGDVVDGLTDAYDSSYTATYWPWIQILDAENNVYIYVPPTRDVVRNIALTDNIAFPWFAVAGIQRGDVDAIKARKKLTLSERDALYENRINPIATFTSDGIKIWGNKTLQVKESALDRINVRRLLLQARKLISAVAIRLLFEQNDAVVRNQFLALVNPILDNIRTERGLTDFRVVLSNSPEDIDRNQLTGKIYLKPTRALEFIIVEFNIMNTGASFDNI